MQRILILIFTIILTVSSTIIAVADVSTEAQTQKAVLITGASTGLGQAMAKNP